MGQDSFFAGANAAPCLDLSGKGLHRDSFLWPLMPASGRLSLPRTTCLSPGEFAMHRLLAVMLLPCAAAFTSGGDDPKQAPNTVNLNGHQFTLPAGFTI